jgi:UDP-2,4-diacetamido-2,4,6-trideoxy-beta-L-altropyranose hydrolase
MLERSYPDPVDWEVTSQALAAHLSAWVVLDGYHFDPAYQHQIHGTGHPLLVIDDVAHLDHYHADVVLNQNINAGDFAYQCDPDTDLLLGTKYVQLRREFWSWRGWQRETSEVARKILVTLGGSDLNNVTLKVVQALQQVEITGLETVVVVGNNNPHESILQAAILKPQLKIRLLRDVADIPCWMAWADLAVSGAGSTCLELAFMGVPAVTIELADNQSDLASGLQDVGVTQNVGWHSDVSPTQIAEAISGLASSVERRMQMVRRGRELVDGAGAHRVVARMWGCRLSLRPALEEDARMVWEWANDPDVRAASFSPEPIEWVRHLQWFGAKVDDPHCRLYIAINEENAPIGQIRFDVNGDDVVAAINVDCRYRRRGYGHEMIRMASERLWCEVGPNIIHAYVVPGNKASVKAFTKAGYHNGGRTRVRGYEAIDLTWMKDPDK